jgi:hypothetical protein
MLRLYYTAEVEAALHSHSAVKQAAVFGVDNGILGQMVHAAVVLRPSWSASPALTQQELIAHARGLLSAYKVRIVIRILRSPMPFTHIVPGSDSSRRVSWLWQCVPCLIALTTTCTYQRNHIHPTSIQLKVFLAPRYVSTLSITSRTLMSFEYSVSTATSSLTTMGFPPY